MSESKNYQQINLDLLVPFSNHPFVEYEGQRFTDMVESIKANGVITPIIVRPHTVEKSKYEILSGHNRVAASRVARKKDITAVVRKDLSDDEALFIVTETNLIQRSFADLRHSERSVVIAVHYESMKKKQGYRSDLLAGIDEDTLCPVGTKSATKDKVAEQYGLSQSTIMRYLRVNKLIKPIKERLDNGEIAMRVAVTLSYLRESEQTLVEKQLADGKKLSIKIANELRKGSEQTELGKGAVKRLFEASYYGTKIKPIKFSGEFLSQYFDEKQSPELIESIVEEALKKYFADK
jgi:ParB family chromosome partitioning protein